jgi:predicted O-methyltransferase YrrM
MKYLSLFFSLSFLTAGEPSWSSFKQETLSHLLETGDWCSAEKAEKMMDLIYETHPRICVEIGVFTGSSIYPTAKALKYLNQGTVYAIDPWSQEECVQGYAPGDPNYLWWSSIDLESIYLRFQSLLSQHELEPFCTTLRMTSQAALSHFADGSIDILHIDGNHTADVALSDAGNWLPKVKEGGYIWFDDANWPTTAKAVAYLQDRCEINLAYSVGNACLLFRKPSP